MTIVDPGKGLDKVEDYRLDYINGKCIGVEITDELVESHVKKITSNLAKHAYGAATTSLVTFCFQAWPSKNPEETICNFVEQVVPLYHDDPTFVSIRGKKKKNWSHRQKQFLYFLAHILLVTFNYGMKQGPFKIEIKFLIPILDTLWNAWDSLLIFPLLHRELLIELWWITLLSKAYIPNLQVPAQYPNWRTEIQKLVNTSYTNKRVLRFAGMAEEWHFSILVLLVKKLAQVDSLSLFLLHFLISISLFHCFPPPFLFAMYLLIGFNRNLTI
jgi:hypothetical protein